MGESVKPEEQAITLLERLLTLQPAVIAGRTIVDTRDKATAIVQALAEAGLIADRDDLLALVDLATLQVGRFTEQGHPGEPCKRTGWIPVCEVEEEWATIREIEGRLR